MFGQAVRAKHLAVAQLESDLHFVAWRIANVKSKFLAVVAETKLQLRYMRKPTLALSSFEPLSSSGTSTLSIRPYLGSIMALVRVMKPKGVTDKRVLDVGSTASAAVR